MKTKDFISSIFIAGLGILIIYLTMTTFPRDEYATGGTFASAAFYPQLVAGLMILLAILMGISALVKKFGTRQTDEKEPVTCQTSEEQSVTEPVVQSKSIWRMLAVCLALILYTLLLKPVGFFLLTPLLMIVFFRLLGIKNWITLMILSFLTSTVIGLFFTKVLQVVLPEGVLFPEMSIEDSILRWNKW